MTPKEYLQQIYNLDQEVELDIHEELGALTFVLITFSFKTFYAVTWGTWKELKESVNKKSLNKKDLDEYEVTMENCLIDFLKVKKVKRNE